LSSRRENSAYFALLLIVAIAVPLYAYGFRSSHPSVSPEYVVGDFQVRSTSVQITGTGLGGLGLSFKAVVYNPNVFGGTLDSANYSVYANGHFVGTGHTSTVYEVSPDSSQTFVFPVSVGWGSTFVTLGGYIVGLGNVSWKVDGNASIEINGIILLVPFALTTG